MCFWLQVYMELEQGKNVDFWRDMTTITEDEISKLRKLEASGKGPGDVMTCTITVTLCIVESFQCKYLIFN